MRLKAIYESRCRWKDGIVSDFNKQGMFRIELAQDIARGEHL
jgi:hypothetical protein